MRKLTKIINKRRKNYKPTIGIDNKSINADVYYINKKKIEKECEKRKIRKMFNDFMREEFPALFELTELIGGMGMYF